MTIEIVEIIGRSEQGVTKPFICRGEDGHVYFVKGRGAGMRSLICEWIAGQIGRRLGLPIAPFEIVVVSQELLSIAMRDDLAELGAGKAFGSRKVSVVELSTTHVEYVPAETQRDVLAFDWWVRNGDRSLGETGRNPNLFWDVENEGLVVIDHNQAFDPTFSPQDFVDLHAFRGEWPVLLGDWVVQQSYAGRFQSALADWQAICNTVPPEWRYVDVEQTVPTNFDDHAAFQLLMRCQTNGFWSLE
jgi:hypothetical protein